MTTLPAKSSLPAMIVALLAAIGASVCCVVPLVLVLLGISGAWIAHLTALDPWRPWFIAATLLCLGLAFWTLYGPSSRCRTEGVCIDPVILRRRRFGLWLALVQHPFCNFPSDRSAMVPSAASLSTNREELDHGTAS